jgi:flagellar assembly protein FliH
MAKIIKSEQAVKGLFATYECGLLGVALEPEGADEGFAEPEECDPAVAAAAEAEQRMQELYEQALRRGLEAGESQFREAVGGAIQALHAAAENLRQAREAYLSTLEPQVIELVQTITQRILRREAQLDPAVAVATVREALRHLADRERVTVVLNPRDLDAIRDQQLDIFAGIEGLGHVELAADDSVSPGGCLLESEQVRVDARLDAQLDQILAGLE